MAKQGRAFPALFYFNLEVSAVPRDFELRETPLSAVATSLYVAPAVTGAVARMSEDGVPSTACAFAAMSVAYAFLAEVFQRADDQMEQADKEQAEVIGSYLKDSLQKVTSQLMCVAGCVTNPEDLAIFVTELDYRAFFIRNVTKVIDSLLAELPQLASSLVSEMPEDVQAEARKCLLQAGIAI